MRGWARAACALLLCACSGVVGEDAPTNITARVAAARAEARRLEALLVKYYGGHHVGMHVLREAFVLRSAPTVNALAERIAGAVLWSRPFAIGAIGNSVLAGHDNCFTDSFPAQASAAMRARADRSRRMPVRAPPRRSLTRRVSSTLPAAGAVASPALLRGGSSAQGAQRGDGRRERRHARQPRRGVRFLMRGICVLEVVEQLSGRSERMLGRNDDQTPSRLVAVFDGKGVQDSLHLRTVRLALCPIIELVIDPRAWRGKECEKTARDLKRVRNAERDEDRH